MNSVSTVTNSSAVRRWQRVCRASVVAIREGGGNPARDVRGIGGFYTAGKRDQRIVALRQTGRIEHYMNANCPDTCAINRDDGFDCRDHAPPAPVRFAP